jgi:capsular exopolysaccharide synthesis family protein
VTLDQIFGAVWRRRLLFVFVALVCSMVVVAVTLSLSPVYKATATIFVGDADVKSVEADQTDTLVRTYATLAGNPNVAQVVATELPFQITRDGVLDRMQFVPLEGTRLIELSGEGATPARAQRLANTYAQTFAERIGSQFPDSGRAATVRIQETASTPTAPVRPQRSLYIGFGVLLALLLAVAAALVRDRTAEGLDLGDAAEFAGHPILARIPMLRRREREGDLQFSDAFRLLKTNLDLNADRPVRSLAVTSPSALEGKTTVALNLSHVLAADDEEVVLVEADLRRPGLTRDLDEAGHRTGPLGLVHLVRGECTLDDVIVTHPENPRLHLVLAGQPLQDPSALLSSAAFASALDALRERFDRVVVDTPPVSVGADASLLATQLDAVLFVLDDSKTKPGAARTALNQLDTVRARINGVVLNRVSKGAATYYFQPYVEERPRRGLRRRRESSLSR